MEEGMKDFAQYACVPGQTEFMPDFFLDDFDDYVKGHKEVFEKSSQSAMKAYGDASLKGSAPAAEKSTGLVQPIFDQISSLINPDLVNKMKTVYAFDITGEKYWKFFYNFCNFSFTRFFSQKRIAKLKFQIMENAKVMVSLLILSLSFIFYFNQSTLQKWLDYA